MIDRTYQDPVRPERTREPFELADYEEDQRGLPVAAAAFGATVFLVIALLMNWVC